MGFTMLILGLVLHCFDAECVGNNELAARLLLVNATEQGPNCNANGCLTCGGDPERTFIHYPLIVYKTGEDVVEDDLNLSDCNNFKEGDVILDPDLRCWMPINKKLCITLDTNEPFKVPAGVCQDHQKPHPNCDKANLRWLGSTPFFDNRYSTLKSLDQDLTPGDGKPTVTWLDVPRVGKLEVFSVGGNARGDDHTIWRRKGGASGSEGRALAEGVLWKINQITRDTTVVIGDCAGGEPKLTLPPGKRVVVLNLPKPIFDKPSNPTVYSKDELEHFRLYYNLFEEPSFGGICDLPVYRNDSGPKSELRPFLIGDWILQGAELKGSLGILTASDTALCPPTKFP